MPTPCPAPNPPRTTPSDPAYRDPSLNLHPARNRIPTLTPNLTLTRIPHARLTVTHCPFLAPDPPAVYRARRIPALPGKEQRSMSLCMMPLSLLAQADAAAGAPAPSSGLIFWLLLLA